MRKLFSRFACAWVLTTMSVGPVIAQGIPGGGSPGGTKPTGEEGESPAQDISMEKAENLLASYVESIAKHRKRNVEWVADAVRDSVAVDAEQAVELGVIDFVAADRRELLAKAEGREVDVAGNPITLELDGVRVQNIEMTLLQAIFNFLADPNVAVILMLGGLMGLARLASGSILPLTPVLFQVTSTLRP